VTYGPEVRSHNPVTKGVLGLGWRSAELLVASRATVEVLLDMIQFMKDSSIYAHSLKKLVRECMGLKWEGFLNLSLHTLHRFLRDVDH
jgi:hypothetical protein